MSQTSVENNSKMMQVKLVKRHKGQYLLYVPTSLESGPVQQASEAGRQREMEG